MWVRKSLKERSLSKLVPFCFSFEFCYKYTVTFTNPCHSPSLNSLPVLCRSPKHKGLIADYWVKQKEKGDFLSILFVFVYFLVFSVFFFLCTLSFFSANSRTLYYCILDKQRDLHVWLRLHLIFAIKVFCFCLFGFGCFYIFTWLSFLYALNVLQRKQYYLLYIIIIIIITVIITMSIINKRFFPQ